jgi:hypothetical protein
VVPRKTRLALVVFSVLLVTLTASAQQSGIHVQCLPTPVVDVPLADFDESAGASVSGGSLSSTTILNLDAAGELPVARSTALPSVQGRFIREERE